MDTSDFITWISALIAIWAFANPYHRLKIKSLNIWYIITIFIGLGFTIFFSIVYPNNLFNLSNFLFTFFDQHPINIISKLKQTQLNSEIIALFLAMVLTISIIKKIFFEKKLNLKTGLDIQNSITLIDEICNESEKLYPELAKILAENINQIIKVLNTTKLEKILDITDTIIRKSIVGFEKSKELEEIRIEGRKTNLIQRIQNHTTIPFQNYLHKSILKNKERLNAVLIIILTDENFLNYLVTREIGAALFLKCYIKSIKSIDSINLYWSRELANVQFVREFFKISLQNSKSKFRIYFDKEIESDLIEGIFSNAEYVNKYDLVKICFDWLTEEFDEESRKPKIEVKLFIKNFEIKLDLLFRFIKKLGEVAQKQKVRIDIYDLIFKISDNLITFLLDYSSKHEDFYFIETNILCKIEQLLDDNILVFDGDGSDSHGLLYLYINFILKLSKIEGSNKYMHHFIEYFSQGGQYTDKMHEHWEKIKQLLANNKYYFTQSEIDKMKRCLSDFNSNPNYLLRVNASKRAEEINNFISSLKTS